MLSETPVVQSLGKLYFKNNELINQSSVPRTAYLPLTRPKSLLDVILKSVLQCFCYAYLLSLIAKPDC